MNERIADRVLLGLPGVEKDFKPEWGTFRYKVDGKMFVMCGGDKEGKPLLTVKLPPEECELLRKAYPGKAVPGYYMNKQHWVSLYVESDIPEAVEEQVLRRSYDTFLLTLTKKRQAELRGE